MYNYNFLASRSWLMREILTAGGVTIPESADAETLVSLIRNNEKVCDTPQIWEIVHTQVCTSLSYTARTIIADTLGVPYKVVRVDANGGRRDTRNQVIDYYNEIAERKDSAIRQYGTRVARYVDALASADKAEKTAEQFRQMFALVAQSKQTAEQTAIIKGFEIDASNARNMVADLARDILSVLVVYADCLGRKVALDDTHTYNVLPLTECATIDDAVSLLEEQIKGAQ